MTTAAHTNRARLKFSIAFIGYANLVGEVESASHQELRGDNYYQDLAEPKDWTGALRGIQHRRDAERQVVNLLADEIYRHLGCQNTAQYKARIRAVRRGTVDLYSDMGPCHSCRSVIKDFRSDFPTLAVDVRYRNALRGGGSAALIPAGEGLFGMYGIGDAVQRADGQWVKSYPGAPVPAATATFDVKVAGPDGDRFRGTLDAVDQQPHAPYLYPAPNATAAPLDEATAVLDKIAQAIRNQMAPGQQMRPQSFRQWIRGIDQGTVQLACERGPGQAGRSAVAAFVADFPKVRIEVAYEAAAAQADGYGYTDATQGPAGTWLKAFAARR
ncbi:deaminase domain-containing protein [Streptomyces erythrochromogenes]|uniref:deaminase domain-containing protein n=1 Tax=Streptomyces erythrochromogenes TaxID=285574 RepID=UPI0036C92750